MSDEYTLTVVNNSELVKPVFAVFAVLPEFMSADSLQLAWLTQQINGGNDYVFSWEMKWQFIWSAQGTKEGYQWNGRGRLAADPGSNDQCRATFDYDGGDWSLLKTFGKADMAHLRIASTPRVPRPSVNPSSVGLTLNGKAVCAIDTGPDLEQVFTLHPTYYIAAGRFIQGQMVSLSSSTKFKELVYSGGNNALTATLTLDNKWEVKPSNSVNFARVLETASA